MVSKKAAPATPRSNECPASPMITESDFKELLGALPRTGPNTHVEFWNHVAKIASHDSPAREALERALQLGDLEKNLRCDMDSSVSDVKCAVVLAAGYCVARPQLARHLDTKALIKTIVSVPRSAQYTKQLCIKCVWAIANVKQTESLAELGTDVMEMMCDILNQKVLKDDANAVHKELVRLLDKMLVSVPCTACQTVYLQTWLPRLLSLTVNKLQVIREKTRDLLKKHMSVLMREAVKSDVNKLVGQYLFGQTNSYTTSSGSLLQELQQLASNGHSGYVIDVWLSLVHMTSKLIMKKTAYSNELFSIPNFFTKNLTDDESRLALLNSWMKVVDIYRADNPDFFATSKQMKFFMTPFFTIKQPSLKVSVALVRSWWYLVVACHELNYINTFTAVLEPCVKTCFKSPEVGEMVQQGGNMLYLLLDSTPPECDLVPIAPSSLNLTDSNHSLTFFKYFDTLIRYKPNSLVISIWSKLCDCVKGTPDPNKMMYILETAMKNVSPLNVMNMVESLSLSTIVTSHYKMELAEYMIRCAKVEDLRVHTRLLNLLKSVSFSDPSYLKLIHRILLFISSDEVEGMQVSCLSLIWETVCNTLSEYIEQTGGQINEGSRIEPHFPTTNKAVSYVFRLFNKTEQMQQSMTQSLCQVWERLVSLFVEHTAQYSSVNVTDDLVKYILESCVQTSALYPLIYCSKVLVEESPVPQLSLLQSSSSSVFLLVAKVLECVHTESKQHGLAPPTLSLCIELCTASWALLTPGRIVPALTSIKSSYIGLLAPDKNYPPAVQNIAKTSYTSLLSCVQKHMTFYTHSELDCLEDYLVYGLKHHKKLVRLTAAKFWNSSFGIAYTGTFSARLRAVIESEAKRSALIVPGNTSDFSVVYDSQTTELSDPVVKIDDFIVKGSFMTKNKEVSPQKAEYLRQAASPSRKNSKVLKRQVNEESQDCIPISTSPKKQKILTRHQKERIVEQRFDRDVPVMYNSLDVNSQEPMLFDMNSQSQTPISPEKEAPFLLPKPTTPAFTSRNLLFLSPSAKKPAACQSVLAKSIALLPTTSPEPPAEDADKNNQTTDSEEDVYCEPSEECSEEINTEPVITPPSTYIPAVQPPTILITEEKAQPTSQNNSNISLSTSLLSPAKGITPVSPSNVGMFTSVLKSMMSYITPSQEKPSSLIIAPNSESESKSTSSETTPSGSNVSSDVTPISLTQSDPVNASLTLIQSPKNTPLLPKEGIIDKTPDTVPETPVSPVAVVLVEDSQDVVLEFSSTTANVIPSSILPDSITEKEVLVDLDTFSDEISFSDCSTALEVNKKKTVPEQTSRRSSRLMPKKMKSEDLGIKKSGPKFKRIKSSEDWCELDVEQPDRIMSPIREEINLSPLRKSVRPRKSSVKLRDASFINPNLPASILAGDSASQESIPTSETSEGKQEKENAIADHDKETKRKSERSTSKNVPEPELENKQKEDENESGCSVNLLTVPDSLAKPTIPTIVEDSVQFIGEVKNNPSKNEVFEQEVTEVECYKKINSVNNASKECANTKSKDYNNTIDNSCQPNPYNSIENTLSLIAKDGIGLIAQDSLKAQNMDGHPVQSIPDSIDEVSIPDSQPLSCQILDSNTSSAVTKVRKSRRITNKTEVTAIQKDTITKSSPNNSSQRKCSKLGIFPHDSKSLITDYLSVTPKSDKVDSHLNFTESPQSDYSQASKELQTSVEDPSPKIDFDSEMVHSGTGRDDSISISDDSLVLMPLPVPSSSSTSPQKTESLSSSSSQGRRGRPRKQSQPVKKTPVPGPKRKSRRLTSKSQQPVEHSQTDSSLQNSQIVEISLPTFVPDSVQHPETDLFDGPSDTLTQDSVIPADDLVDLRIPSSQQKAIIPLGTNNAEDIPSSQVLSLEVSFSQKKEVFSPVDIQEEITQSNASETVILSVQPTPTSVESIETFGKIAVKEEFSFNLQHTPELQQTPQFGLDTFEDLPFNIKEQQSDADIEKEGPSSGLGHSSQKKNEDSACEKFGVIGEIKKEDQTENKTFLEDSHSGQGISIYEKIDELTHKKYKEFDEFEECDISEIFCASSQETESSPIIKPVDSIPESSLNIVPDSQAFDEPNHSEQPAQDVTSRSLRRKPSIPSNLPDVMQDLVDIELSQMETLEHDANTPPKSLKQETPSTPVTPSTPITPSSILKRAKDPGSASPSSSKRRVTFGPLPEPHRDPNEITPRRHHKYRKSPASVPVQPPAPTEEAIYPNLVHCTVLAYNIIRNLCSGFSLSQRTFNLSIASSSIKTIGDLARMTPAQVEEFPFIAPKVIQVRRQLKKYESNLSPTMSAKSFLLGTKARGKLKMEPDSLQPVSEMGMEKENVASKCVESIEVKKEDIEITKEITTPAIPVPESVEIPGAEEEGVLDDCQSMKSGENGVVVPLENDNKENIDPNQKLISSPEDSKKADLDEKVAVEDAAYIIEETLTDESEKVISIVPSTIEELVHVRDEVQETSADNDLESNAKSIPAVMVVETLKTVIQNQSSKSVCQPDAPVIVVGCTTTNMDPQKLHFSEKLEEDNENTIADQELSPIKMIVESNETSEPALHNFEKCMGKKILPPLYAELDADPSSDDDHDEVMRAINDSDDEIDVKINKDGYISNESETSLLDESIECDVQKEGGETSIAKDNLHAIEEISFKNINSNEQRLKGTVEGSLQRSPESEVLVTNVLCEDSPLDLICREKLSIEAPSDGEITCVPESSIESMSQCISKNIADLAKDAIISQVSESQIIADSVKDMTILQLTESEEEMLNTDILIDAAKSVDPPSTTYEKKRTPVAFSSDLARPSTEVKTDIEKTSKIESYAEVEDDSILKNGLVDYPNTQPNLVDYPLTQPDLSFESEIESIENKLRTISDPLVRASERFRIIELLSRNSRCS